MNQEEIKKEIDQLHDELQGEVMRGSFVLNKRVAQLNDRIFYLQSLCKHDYASGICVYCGKVEE